MNPFLITDDRGHLIETLGRWRELAPSRYARQWKRWGSARVLAERWLEAAVPEIDALLDSSPGTRGFVPASGVAMKPTRLDGNQAGVRKHDLWVVGRAAGGRTVLSVDPRADELYGRTVEERVFDAEPGMKIVDRASFLSQLVFSGPPEAVYEVRYHLLVAVAAAILEARRHDAQQVVFIEHEYRSPMVPREVSGQNAVDFDKFVRKLTHGLQGTSPGKLVGPVEIIGDGSRVPLYLGRTVVDLG